MVHVHSTSVSAMRRCLSLVLVFSMIVSAISVFSPEFYQLYKTGIGGTILGFCSHTVIVLLPSVILLITYQSLRFAVTGRLARSLVEMIAGLTAMATACFIIDSMTGDVWSAMQSQWHFSPAFAGITYLAMLLAEAFLGTTPVVVMVLRVLVLAGPLRVIITALFARLPRNTLAE